jgi:hypothetical protein
MSNVQTHPARKSGTASRAKAGAAKRAVNSTAKQQSAVSISPPAAITAEERHRRIAEAAYYRALRRGFHGGADLEDWLESEAEIDRLVLRS